MKDQPRTTIGQKCLRSVRSDRPEDGPETGYNLRVFVYCDAAPNLWVWYKDSIIPIMTEWPGEAMIEYSPVVD